MPSAPCLRPFVQHLRDPVHLLEIALGDGPTVHSVLGREGPPDREGGGGIHVAVHLEPVVHDHANDLLADESAVVHRPLSSLCFVPWIDRPYPEFEIHASGHPVAQRNFDREEVETVEMRVNEAGRHHVSFGIDLVFARDLLRRDLGDPAITNPDIGDLIEICLRVHDPAIENNDVKFLSPSIAEN